MLIKALILILEDGKMLYYKSKLGQFTRLDRLEDLPTGNGLWADDECYIAIDLSIVDSYAAADMIAEITAVMYDWSMIQEDNLGDRAAILINAGSIDLINKALDRLWHWSGEAWSISDDRSLYPVSIIDDDGDSDIIGYSDTLTYPDDWQSLDYRIDNY
jgi:hypothetical protein